MSYRVRDGEHLLIKLNNFRVGYPSMSIYNGTKIIQKQE